jgi:hypothetical protein
VDRRCIAPARAKTGQPEITGTRRLSPKSMMLWRYWMAKPSVKSEIACGGSFAIVEKARSSSSRVVVAK